MARIRVKVPSKSFWKRAGWLSLAILFVGTALGVGLVSFWQNTQQDNNPPASKSQTTLKGTKLPDYTPVANVPELKTSDQTAGNGKTATVGSTVAVQYIGAFASSGVIFDTSIDNGQPVTFQLSTGPNGVIPGFAQGIEGMKVGGTRQILIPAALGYGAQGSPPTIPPNSDLVFSVSLVDVK